MAKLDAFNFKWTPFSEMDFKICDDDRAPLNRCDVCNLCRQSLDDENHVTACCNASCHKWCDEQCHNYLCKCPLCKSAAGYDDVKIFLDYDSYFSAAKKARLFSQMYNSIQKKKFCVCIPRFGDLNPSIPREEYRHFVNLINEYLDP